MLNFLKVLANEGRFVRVVRAKYWLDKNGLHNLEIVTEVFGVQFNLDFSYDGETISINHGRVILANAIEQMWHDVMRKFENEVSTKTGPDVVKDVLKPDQDVGTSATIEIAPGVFLSGNGVWYSVGKGIDDDPTDMASAIRDANLAVPPGSEVGSDDSLTDTVKRGRFIYHSGSGGIERVE